MKDASHVAFYAGFGKGFASGLDGVLLFFSKRDVRDLFQSALHDAVTAQIGYVVLVIAVVLLLREPTGSLSEFLWTLSRWARMVTLVVTLFLDRKSQATEAMFFTALRATNPQFADAVRSQAPNKPSSHEKFKKYKRIAKMASLRIATYICTRFFPGSKPITIPIIKYVSMRQTLGDLIAASVALVHVLPDSLLQTSHVDDMLLTFTEAILDADDLGFDAVRPYVKRLDGEVVRKYFRQRYRGYITGMGFLYSVFMQVPLLGIPLVLVAECGAAVVVVDIATRNLEKHDRLQLTGEHVLATAPHRPENSNQIR